MEDTWRLLQYLLDIECSYILRQYRLGLCFRAQHKHVPKNQKVFQGDQSSVFVRRLYS